MRHLCHAQQAASPGETARLAPRARRAGGGAVSGASPRAPRRPQRAPRGEAGSAGAKCFWKAEKRSGMREPRGPDSVTKGEGG